MKRHRADAAGPAEAQRAAAELPTITVVTPAYNSARFLKDCIASVLDQNYPNLEYIVIDGGSSDGSVELIRAYEDAPMINVDKHKALQILASAGYRRGFAGRPRRVAVRRAGQRTGS